MLCPTHLSTAHSSVSAQQQAQGDKSTQETGPAQHSVLQRLNGPTGLDSHFPFAFLLKVAALGRLAADEARETCLLHWSP